MFCLVGICFIYFLRVASASADPIVDYYVNLISNETARAYTYSLPRDSSEFRPVSNTLFDYGTFDYIIVGAGSAGSVIANRLSAVPDNQVLLIEAGGYESDYSDIPAMMFFLQGLEYNWNYNSTPQTGACLGMVDQQCSYPRGRGLGGTSIMNGLMYIRGNRLDYDKWYLQGNPGWSYEEVLPYFIRSEDSHVAGDEGYHGTGGNLNVQYADRYNPQVGAFIAANLELGRKYVDFNGQEQVGVSLTQFNTINGRRQSTGKAFLTPVINRPNLTILTQSLVTRILIEPPVKKAYGVVFSNAGQKLIAKARKEVIVSAGAIGSPQLLMLSGIGPEDHLNGLGIPVIQPLAVGDNFHDHPNYYGFTFETSYMEPIRDLQDYVREYVQGVGPLTSPTNVQSVSFLETGMSKISGYPDIEIIMIPSNSTSSFIQRVLHLTDETYNATFGRVDTTRSVQFFVLLLHPKSRGTIRLKSSDPYDYPLIDPAFLSDPYGEDIETMYQGVQLALEIINTNAFRAIDAKLNNIQLPACQSYQYLSRDYWYCQIRQTTSNIFHPTGSCKMGPDPQKGAVVNHELKVHGITNLRVADASIIPEITSGHLNAASIMIGEKVSDMIIKEECSSF